MTHPCAEGFGAASAPVGTRGTVKEEEEEKWTGSDGIGSVGRVWRWMDGVEVCGRGLRVRVEG